MKRRTALQTGEAQETKAKRLRLLQLPLESIYGGLIPARMEQDELLIQLAASIRKHGLLQPIVVRRSGQADRYAVVCGQRRLAACRMLGMRRIDALLVDSGEKESIACFFEEHMTRRCVSPVDEAELLSRSGAAAAIAESEVCAVRMRRCLHLLSLCEPVRRLIRERALTLEQAEPLVRISSKQRQNEAAVIIAERALTPAQARRLVCGPPCTQNAGAFKARRRILRSALEEVSRTAMRLRAQGVGAEVALHSQEKGMCVKLMISCGEKTADMQDSL